LEDGPEIPVALKFQRADASDAPHNCTPTTANNVTCDCGLPQHAASPAVSATRAASVLAFLLAEVGLPSGIHERDS
jgi:hypothetical protein